MARRGWGSGSSERPSCSGCWETGCCGRRRGGQPLPVGRGARGRRSVGRLARVAAGRGGGSLAGPGGVALRGLRRVASLRRASVPVRPRVPRGRLPRPVAGEDRQAAARRALGVPARRALRRGPELGRTAARGGARGRMAAGGASKVAGPRPRRDAGRLSGGPAPDTLRRALRGRRRRLPESPVRPLRLRRGGGVRHHSLTVALAWFSAGALWVSLLAQGRRT
jgi:hypothetical protein